MQRKLSLIECVSLACAWEATVPKPGNVHRGADFEDTTLYDFLASGILIGGPLASAGEQGVGRAACTAVEASRAAVRTNTHLGTILLLAPLCAVPDHVRLAEGTGDVLTKLTARDARDLYAAIRLANPGGLGVRAELDIHDESPHDVLVAMRSAADHDMVARQYATNFEDLFQTIVPCVHHAVESRGLAQGLIFSQLKVMSKWPDSLIARKCGPSLAEEASLRADRVLRAGAFGAPDYDQLLSDFDFWLRSDGNRRNPGTTADLLAAALFVVLRDGMLRTW